jgi:hypothetical protein
MQTTKIYGLSLNGATPLLAAGVVHTVTKAGVTLFVEYASHPTRRAELSAIPGVTVFDSHLSPAPMRSTHAALLNGFGVGASDTAWSAIQKLTTALGVGGLFDVNV